MKYNEEEILKEILDYIESTYKSHYVSKENEIQVNDLIMAIGHGQGSYIANAIEYLCRYGKKEGNNIKDLYKAVHNIILLIHHDFKRNDILMIYRNLFVGIEYPFEMDGEEYLFIPQKDMLIKHILPPRCSEINILEYNGFRFTFYGDYTLNDVLCQLYSSNIDNDFKVQKVNKILKREK